MIAVPTVIVDRLPRRLWRPGNLRLGGRLHFCYRPGDGVRTIEWHGRTVAAGARAQTTEQDTH